MTETGYKDHRVLIDSLRNSLIRRGFKCFFRTGKVEGRGYGCTVSVVDPVDPSDICFSVFLTWDDFELVIKANAMFWRFLG